jgi:hypothetical protein
VLSLSAALLAGAALAPAPVRSGTPPPAAAAAASASSVRFTAAGDFGKTRATAKVLDLARAHGSFLLALGDLAYGDATEPAWCAFVKSRVGRGYPVQLLSGNHESSGRDGRIDRFTRCLPNRLPGVKGNYGRQWYVDVPAANPVARIVMISPGLRYENGTWRYTAGTPRYRWTQRAIRSARAAGIDWVVVGMHHPCLSMGRYGCTAGSDLMNLLVRQRVDLVLTGHEHMYQRSKQITTGPGCRRVPTGRIDRDCIASSSSTLRKGAGTVFVTVGTGGTNLRPVSRNDRQKRYFAAWSGRNASPRHGLLAVDIDAGRLTARFVGTSPGTFTDAVTIRR